MTPMDLFWYVVAVVAGIGVGIALCILAILLMIWIVDSL